MIFDNAVVSVNSYKLFRYIELYKKKSDGETRLNIMTNQYFTIALAQKLNFTRYPD